MNYPLDMTHGYSGLMTCTSIVIQLLFLCKLCTFSDGEADSCGPRASPRMLHPLPCDLSQHHFCSKPGSAYPWHKVRKFVRENHALMRRMYGDVRQVVVIRREIGSRTLQDGRKLTLDDEDDYLRVSRPQRKHIRKNSRKPLNINKSSTESSKTSTIRTLVTSTEQPMEVSTTTEPKMDTDGQDRTLNISENVTSAVTSNDSITTFAPSEDADSTNGDLPEDFTTDNRNGDRDYLVAEQIESHFSDVNFDEEIVERVSEAIHGDDSEEEHDLATRITTTLKTTSTTLEQKATNLTDKSAEEITSSAATTTTSTTTTTTTPKPNENYEEDATQVDNDNKQDNRLPPLRGINACPVVEEVVAPYWANNTRGETLALMNIFPFEQYIHSEKCVFENKQMYCREGCLCEQQYRLHRLLAFDPTNDCRGIFADWFRFPSCCICKCYDLGDFNVPRESRFSHRQGRRKTVVPIPLRFREPEI
ncbi:spz4 (predicted) [Pycnogonum litorale]